MAKVYFSLSRLIPNTKNGIVRLFCIYFNISKILIFFEILSIFRNKNYGFLEDLFNIFVKILNTILVIRKFIFPTLLNTIYFVNACKAFGFFRILFTICKEHMRIELKGFQWSFKEIDRIQKRSENKLR